MCLFFVIFLYFFYNERKKVFNIFLVNNDESFGNYFGKNEM